MRSLRTFVPLSLKRGLKLIASLVVPDAAGSFRLGPKAAAAAKARFRAIDWNVSSSRRIIYALTPTAELRNVGDHAQAVAIHRWLAKHYPDLPVVEIDKDLAIACIGDLRSNVRPEDIIFLHSGGNLGDRGRWSETGRRFIISNFPGNRIISLPQTIYFSDTVQGATERNISRAVYKRHPSLTVLGRDAVSGDLAAQLFPNAQTGTCPDFVLSLQAADFELTTDPRYENRVLACLRQDSESAFDGSEGRMRLVEQIGAPATLSDTTLDQPIPPEERLPALEKTLSLFASHEAVVTDRYHGLIFAVICRKPAVVLRTVDHKLTSAIEWFKDIPNVRFCRNAADLPMTLEQVRSVAPFDYPDFNSLYFDRLPEFLCRS